MSNSEDIFTGWGLFITIGVPIIIIVNAFIMLCTAVWIRIHPNKPMLKYLAVFSILLIISFVLNLPEKDFLKWIILTIFFGVIPYGCTGLVLLSIIRRSSNSNYQELLVTLPGTNIIYTIFCTMIYTAFALFSGATPD